MICFETQLYKTIDLELLELSIMIEKIIYCHKSEF